MNKFVFEGNAINVGRHVSPNEVVHEIGVWTDGIGLFYDCEFYAGYKLVKGKRYRVTVEEITPQEAGDKECDFCGTINDAHHSAECVDRRGGINNA